MAEQAPLPTARTRTETIKRILIGIASFVTLLHLFFTFLWIAPTSSLREIVPGDVLEKYMIPLFGQSWSVFAPEPINGDYYFDLRAIAIRDGKEIQTKWIRATDVELAHARYHLFPPRPAGVALSTASDLKGAWDKLPADQKKVAELGYFKGADWQTRMEAKMYEYKGSRTVVANYLEKDRYATAYATQVAKAVWGPDVTRVEFQVARQNVVPYADRNKPDATRPELQIASTGWRGTIEVPGQDEKKFADYFCNGPEKVCES